MTPQDDWSDCFYRWGLYFLRNGAYPAFGIATAQALMEPDPTMLACLGTGLGIWVFTLSLAMAAFATSWLLSDEGPLE